MPILHFPLSIQSRVLKSQCHWKIWRYGSYGDQNIPTFMVGLAEEVELRDGGEEEEEEDTLGEAVEKVIQIPVGVVVDPTMLETISRMNVVTTTLAMVR